MTESWSPLGRSVRRSAATTNDPVRHATISGLAAKYGKSPAQIVLRWHIEHGLVTIPKSFRPERIAENIDSFDFEPTADEVTAIDAMDRGARRARPRRF